MCPVPAVVLAALVRSRYRRRISSCLTFPPHHKCYQESHVPVPAWSSRALCSDEWREVECSHADTRVDWAAAPRMGGPVGPYVKRRRVHYNRWDRLRDLYDSAGLQSVCRWDGQGWVDEWAYLGGPSGPMYGDLDLSGVT